MYWMGYLRSEDRETSRCELFFAPDPRQTSLTNLGCSTRPCSQRVAAAIGDPGLVVRRGTLRVDLVDGTPSLVGVCELPTSVLRSGSSPDITDQPGVLNTTRGPRPTTNAAAASHSSPSSAPACAASVLAHAPERGTQAGELLLQTRSGPATGTCSEADDGDDASEADDVAARQFAGLTRLQLDEVGRERQVQQQGRQRAEAPAERSVEFAQAMVPLADALAHGGG